MAEGDIGAVVDSLEFEENFCFKVDIVHVSGDVYAIAFQGADSDGWLKTVTIADDGAIGAAFIDDWEFDIDHGETPRIIHIAGNVFAIVYWGPPSNGWLGTVTIADNGTITAAWINTLEFDAAYGNSPEIIHISDDVFAIVYTGGEYDGWLKTVTIAADGVIGGAVVDELEFDDVECWTPRIIHIKDTVYAIVYRGPLGDGWLKTVTIAENGDIGAAALDELEFDAADGIAPTIIHVTGEIYAIAYTSTLDDGWLKTVTIADNGDIGAAVIDSFEFDIATGQNCCIIHVSGKVYAIAYKGTAGDGFLKTVTIEDDGDIIEPVVDSFEFDEVAGLEPEIIHIAGNVYAIAYQGPDVDGWLKTITIETLLAGGPRHGLLMGIG